MQNVVKKVYISILTCVIVMITMVATTFAWVGILTTTSVGGFSFEIESNDSLKDYEILISTDGINFSNKVSELSIKQQILKNLDKDYESLLSNPNDESSLNRFFDLSATLSPVTADLINNQLVNFREMQFSKNSKPNIVPSKSYFKYDLYFMVKSNNELNEDTSINSNLIISNLESSLTGIKCSGTLINDNPFVNSPMDFKYGILKEIPRRFTIDSSSSARFALSIYKPIDKDDNYINETPIKTFIYQGGTYEPSKKGDIYSLGGILPEEYNLALKELNTNFNTSFNDNDLPIGRDNDYELTSGENLLWEKASIIDTNNVNFFGIHNNVITKIKVSVYLWFEGWDADCLNFIDHSNIALDLVFSIDY